MSYPGLVFTVLPRRFWSKVEYAPSGCLLWTGALASNGYGSFSLDGRARSAHSVAFAAFHGPPAVGLQVDHLCRVRRCVNPLHMEAVPAAENMRRADLALGIRTAAIQCPRRHPLVGNNVRVNSNGHRYCRECENEAKRRRRKQTSARPLGPSENFSQGPVSRLAHAP